ncbi:MAG: hypothetical protein QOK48_2550 [Blastocatellia bacterium]|jgi:hypothetical protein|nr:hypothetical protein [Blastocatellia bacterium]
MSAAAGAAAIANAIKASGVVVRVEPEDFAKILGRIEKPLVIYSKGGWFSTKHQYLVSYKGFAFYTKTSSEIFFPSSVEVINTRSIWIPS